MKSLNKTATEIFNTIVKMVPPGETHITLDAGDQEHGGGVMALHVERIGSVKYGHLWSFAHYYKQNGDMMRDPDIVMLRSLNPDALTGEHQFFPTSYRQDGLGIDREYVIFNRASDGWQIAKKQQADLAGFCNTWARNLKEQQKINVVHKHACPAREGTGMLIDFAAIRTRTADIRRQARNADRRARNAILREMCGTSAHAAREDGGF